MSEVKKKKSSKQKVYTVLAAVFFVGFFACVAWLVSYYIGISRAESGMEDIIDNYVQTEPVGTPAPTPAPTDTIEVNEPEQGVSETEQAELENESKYPGLEGFDVPQMSIDFEALKAEKNADIYAWIKVPGTKIDYPVLQHPTDDTYYLNYNIDGSKGYPGCIYTELCNNKDWEDVNTVLYGHNMKNGTMFAGLHHYEDSQFFEENPYIYLYTEDGRVLVYQIFAAYEFSNIHLIYNFRLDDPEIFDQYINGVYALEGMNNNFNTELDITAEDKLITLETCIASKPDKRYLVQGVLTAVGEMP